MRPAPAVTPIPLTPRYAGVDALRGFAMVWMTVFHFCFDLQQWGYLQANFYTDPVWTLQRSAIVALFTFCAGLGQAIAAHQGQGWPRFWRRWCQLVACALLVTAGSYALYPQSFIYFGILHGLALMLLVARITVRAGRWLWLLGALAIALPWWAPVVHQALPALEVLNTPALNWLGFISRKPITEDYAPLLPWLGLVWWGMAAGQWCLQHRPRWLDGTVGTAFAPSTWLAAAGRWSLSYYLLHQPVLIGLLALWSLSRG